MTVAVVDGGIDDRSPDLVRPDGTSVVSGVIDITHATPSLVHGTAVAGIIAARANNGIGIAGIDQSVRILDVRVVGADGTIDPRDEARGIIRAVEQGRQGHQPLARRQARARAWATTSTRAPSRGRSTTRTPTAP